MGRCHFRGGKKGERAGRREERGGRGGGRCVWVMPLWSISTCIQARGGREGGRKVRRGVEAYMYIYIYTYIK